MSKFSFYLLDFFLGSVVYIRMYAYICFRLVEERLRGECKEVGRREGGNVVRIEYRRIDGDENGFFYSWGL